MPGFSRFSVGGRSADTAATADHVAHELWNPHASISLYVVEIGIFLVGATASNGQLIRTSTKGTAGSTVTPDIDNHYPRRFAPISGATLELASFGAAQPTVQGPPLRRFNFAGAAGAGFIFDFRDEPIEIPAGTGLAIATPTATIFQDSDSYWVWDE